MERSFEVKSGGTFFLKSDPDSAETESHDSDFVEIKMEKEVGMRSTLKSFFQETVMTYA
jgi:hypothetical protein